MGICLLPIEICKQLTDDANISYLNAHRKYGTNFANILSMHALNALLTLDMFFRSIGSDARPMDARNSSFRLSLYLDGVYTWRANI